MPDVFFDTAGVVRFSNEKMQKVNLFESPRMFCDVYCLRPGQAQKRHAHAAADKVYHVLTGEARVEIGDEVATLGPGMVAVAPAGVDHGVAAAGEATTTLLVVMARPDAAGRPAPDGGAGPSGSGAGGGPGTG